MSEPVREPFDAFTPLRDVVNRLFDDGFITPERLLTGHMIPVDIIETPEEYRIEASLTGVKPENVQITTAANTVTIRVGRKSGLRAEEEGTYLRRERIERRGPEMSRTVSLPAKVDPDKVSATYEHGMLIVHVGKSEESKPRTITLHISEAKES